MNVTHGWKILQIVAAQAGWKAIYCQESANQQVKISHRVIICWALVDAVGAGDAHGTEVRGIVQESSRLGIVGDSLATGNTGDQETKQNQYFIGYNDPDAHKESDFWIEQANLRIKAEKGEWPVPRRRKIISRLGMTDPATLIEHSRR